MAPPGAQVQSYGFLVYGSQSGYQNTRAQIELNGTSPGQTVGFIRFCDPGVAFPADTFNNDIVTMYLPVSMFEPVLTILRTEKNRFGVFHVGAGILVYGQPICWYVMIRPR